ncbi:MAG: heme biosynthesis HemY N-terminal domain-containing protein [Pseudohongiellaceae bacterium]
MRRLFIFSLLAIVVALWVTLYLGFPEDPGYLLIAFGDYTFETSLFALLVAVAILYLVVRLLALALRIVNPAGWFRAGRRLANRSRSGKRSRTIDGLLHLTRRNWQSAYNTLMRASRDSDASVVNYLAAAYAAFELGQKDIWASCLNQAEKQYPSAHSTIHMLKAQLLYRSGQLEQCLAMLEMLRKTALNDKPLLRMLKDVYLQLGEWQKLEKIMPALQAGGIVDEAESEKIEQQILIAELQALAAAHENDTPDTLIKALEKRWKKAPGAYRWEHEVVNAYADLLYAGGAWGTAASVIEQALNKQWNTDLVRRYGERDYGDAASQLAAAESWLKARPADAELFLCLARLALRNHLWGKAREYYQASIKIAPSVAAYGELARLYKHLGETRAFEASLAQFHDLSQIDVLELPMPEPQARITGTA